MDNQKTAKLIDFLNKNYRKNATEIRSGIAALDSALESTLQSINTDIQALAKAKKYAKITELSAQSEVISDFQKEIGVYWASLAKPEVKPEPPTVTVDPVDDDFATDRTRPHTLKEDFTHKKVCTFSINGIKYTVDDWRGLLIETCNILFMQDPKKFSSFVNDPDFHGREIKYFSREDVETKNVKLKDSDIYVWVNLSANSIRDIVSKMIGKYNIQDYKVYIRADYSLVRRQLKKK